jgi:hypothetical protein
MSSSELLRTPTYALQSTSKKKAPDSTAMQLPEVTQIQLLWREHGKERLFRMYRDGKHWWVVRLGNHGESWGYPLKSHAPKRILAALRHLKPADRSEFAPQNPKTQISLFAAGKRFLMRVIQAPVDRGPTAIYKGEWLVYHRGQLYEQPARGALGGVVPSFVRTLKRLSRQRGMLLPLHSASMDFRRARGLAQQLHKQRMSLKRCFKKRQFPSNIGPLQMQLNFLPSGKIKKLRILTRKHTKHKVVWCIWWFAKKFKLAPTGMANLEYKLVIPPSGP